MFIRFLSCVYGIANLELNCIDVAIFLVLSKDATPFSIPKFSKTFTHHFSFSSYRSLRYMQRKTPNSPRVYDTYIELVSSWWLGKKTSNKKDVTGKSHLFLYDVSNILYHSLPLESLHRGYDICRWTSASWAGCCSFWLQHFAVETDRFAMVYPWMMVNHD